MSLAVSSIGHLLLHRGHIADVANAVGAAVLVQVTIMVAICLVVLVDRRAALSGIPFSWSHLTGGLAGLSAGFPLALFMFIGWKTAPRSPRRLAIHGAPYPRLSTSRWVSRPPCSSSSPTRPLPDSATTSLPSAAHRARS